MYLVHSASKDTYITNKIINSSTRATDANVGAASTIDLFKLYNETTITGETSPIELSRGLIKFNLGDISSSLEGKVSFDHSSFKATLYLHDVQGNQVAPAGFNISAFPLAKEFDEGKGKDIASFNYLGRSNWVTSSYNSENILWETAGAFESGTFGSSIDIIEDGIIGAESVYLVGSQYFDKGNEDLSIDVTTVVSASMVGILPDFGFLLSYSGSEETDSHSRFVKRFASRHTRNAYIRPKLIISYDDSIIDNSNSMEFNVTGSIFLESFQRNSVSNLFSGSANTEILGEDCVIVKLHTGSYEKAFTGSQHTVAGISIEGMYGVSMNIDKFVSESVTTDATLGEFVNTSGSITFGQEWLSIDETVSYFTGSLVMTRSEVGVNTNAERLNFKVKNNDLEFASTDNPKINVFISDLNSSQNSVRIPSTLKTIVLDSLFYRVRDAYNNKILTPFTETNNVTRISSNGEEMYFRPSLRHLPKGKAYTFDFLLVDNGSRATYPSNYIFKVV